MAAHITRKTGSAPVTPLSTYAWLKKVCCVATAFQGLTGILVTPALSAMFGARVPIHLIANTPPKQTRTIAPTADDIKATIATHGMVKYTACTFIPGRPELFDGLTAEVAAAAANRGAFSLFISLFHPRVPHATHADRPYTGVATHIHCESALLCYLWARGEKMLPYIGLSELPCIFCAMYFMAYRDIRGIETTTRGTEGGIDAGAWTCPESPDVPNDAAAFQSQFCERLRQYIQKRLLDEHFQDRKQVPPLRIRNLRAHLTLHQRRRSHIWPPHWTSWDRLRLDRAPVPAFDSLGEPPRRIPLSWCALKHATFYVLSLLCLLHPRACHGALARVGV